MDVNSIMAVIRFILMVATIVVISVIYCKLRFHGFLTLAVGFAFSVITLAAVALGLIPVSGFAYQTLLMVVAVMFLTSALLIYDAFFRFRNETKNKK